MTKRKTNKKKTTTQPEWQRLEKIIAEIQEHITPDAEIRHNHHITGKSGRRRQLDVTVSQKIGVVPIFIVIECKRYTRRVGIDKVEQFAKKLEDVRASYGVMISNTGFDAGARAIAVQENIMLRTYREAEETDWKRIFETFWITLSDFTFKVPKVSAKLEGFPAPIDTSFYIILFKENGEDYYDITPKRFTLASLFWDWWNDRAEHPRKIGNIQAAISGINPPAFVEIQGNRLVKAENFIITGRMIVEQYVMPLGLSEGKVIEDTDTNNLEYVKVDTNDFNVSRIRQYQKGTEISPEEWEKIDKPSPFEFSVEEGYDYKLSFTGGNR